MATLISATESSLGKKNCVESKERMKCAGKAEWPDNSKETFLECLYFTYLPSWTFFKAPHWTIVSQEWRHWLSVHMAKLQAKDMAGTQDKLLISPLENGHHDMELGGRGWDNANHFWVLAWYSSLPPSHNSSCLSRQNSDLTHDQISFSADLWRRENGRKGHMWRSVQQPSYFMTDYLWQTDWQTWWTT